MNSRASIAVVLLAVLTLVWPTVGTASASHTEWGIKAGLPPTAAAPAAPTPKVNVAIQAGHWKSNELPDALARLRTSTGAYGGGRNESQVTLDIAQRVASLLRSKGRTVEVLPATVPTGYEADLFVSLHADGNASSKPRGYKVSTRWRSDVAALDATLVQAIDDGYSKVTGMPQDPSVTRAMRGYYAYSTYRGEEYRLSDTTPAAILEMGFMSSPADRALMFNKPDVVARGVVAGIDNFYARRAEARRLQTSAERQAAASPYDRSIVILSDSVNIRSSASATSAKLASAEFGDSFMLMQPTGPRQAPAGSPPPDPRHGTQLAIGSGWYKIGIGAGAGDAYINRDLVVVQQ